MLAFRVNDSGSNPGGSTSSPISVMLTCHFETKCAEISFEDPAAALGGEEQVLEAFRGARDEIHAWIEATFKG